MIIPISRVLSLRGQASDQTLLDYLTLVNLRTNPGMVTVRDLRQRWGCSQSQVSRRLASIDRLTHWSVQGWQGGRDGFWLAPRLAPAPVLPEPVPSPRERWEALRLKWREVAP